VYPPDAPYAARVRELLDPWHESTLMARMERNRVRLYARVLELQDQLRRAGLGSGRVALALEDRMEALEAENTALRLERARLREQLADRTPG
jgi:regulator of replication initiation timing